jgi:hypothetical protein
VAAIDWADRIAGNSFANQGTPCALNQRLIFSLFYDISTVNTFMNFEELYKHDVLSNYLQCWQVGRHRIEFGYEFAQEYADHYNELHFGCLGISFWSEGDQLLQYEVDLQMAGEFGQRCYLQLSHPDEPGLPQILQVEPGFDSIYVNLVPDGNTSRTSPLVLKFDESTFGELGLVTAPSAGENFSWSSDTRHLREAEIPEGGKGQLWSRFGTVLIDDEIVEVEANRSGEKPTFAVNVSDGFKQLQFAGARTGEISDKMQFSALDYGIVASKSTENAGMDTPSQQAEPFFLMGYQIDPLSDSAGVGDKNITASGLIAQVKLRLLHRLWRAEKSLLLNLTEPRLTCDAAKLWCGLMPFLPKVGLSYSDTKSLVSKLNQTLGSDREAYLANWAFRMALLPFHLHLQSQRIRHGTSPVSEKIPDESGADHANPQNFSPDNLILGDTFLVPLDAHPSCALPMVTLPEGEWIDYYNGTRYKGGQRVQCEPLPESARGRLPLFVKSGAVIPMFDLATRSVQANANFAVAKEEEETPAPDSIQQAEGIASDEKPLLLKIFPLGNCKVDLFDPFAEFPPDGIIKSYPQQRTPSLTVEYDMEADHLKMSLAAWRVGADGEVPNRSLLLMIKTHKPTNVLEGNDPKWWGPLARVELDREFDRLPNCWMYHPYRDEVLVKIRLNGSERRYLKIEFE